MIYYILNRILFYCVAIFLLDHLLIKKENETLTSTIFWALLIICVDLFLYLLGLSNEIVMLFIVGLYFIPYLFYFKYGSIIEKINTIFLVFNIYYSIVCLTLCIDLLFFKYQKDNYILLIINILLFLLISRYILIKKKEYIYTLDINKSLYFLPISIFECIGYLYINTLLNTTTITYSFIIIAFCFIVICTLTFILYVTTLKDDEKQKQQELQLQSLLLEKKQQDKDIETYNTIKKFKHDMKNIFLSVNNAADNKDYEKIKNIVSDIEKMSILSIEDHIHSVDSNLNYLLNTKIQQAKEKNIDIVCAINLTHQIYLNPIDFNIIVGNAIDNAIENTKDNIVRIEIIEKEKIEIEITNLIDSTFTFKTRKEYGGYGIQNMKKIAYKNNISLNFNVIENYFICKIII